MAVAFGRYQLLKKIASGGMGQVFLARTAQAAFDKLVVIKRILPHLAEDEEFLDMFFDEARIAARLNHPNLVQIFELGEVDGMHFLAMEYVQGDDVRRVEKQSRKLQMPLPLGATCRIIADAAAGLDYAHKLKDPQGRPLNLIHRDVSPQNVLVGFDGGVKLIDFGVARAAGRAQHTATGILKGKYPYMSPEQIAGEEYDHRSDQFALAIVFWEILTGRRLFKGDSDLVTMRLVRECNVPAPSTLNPALPKALNAIVLKALSPKPKDRFANTGEFRMAIEDFTVSSHIAATPAHLAAYMRGLYAERIERESDISSLDELTGPSAFDEDSKPTKPSSSRASAQVLGAVDIEPPLAHEPSRPQTQAMTAPRKARGGLPIPVIAAAVVVAVGAAVGIPMAMLGGKTGADPPRVAPIAQTKLDDAPSPTPAAQAPPPAEPARPVTLQLTSKPAGAEVWVNGRKLGVTPVTYTLAPGTSSAEAVFMLSGHEPVHATLTQSSEPTVFVELHPVKKKVGGTKQKESEPPSLGIKTGR